MVLHNYHHINISSYVVFPLGGNGFYCKYLKDAFLSLSIETKTT